MKHILFIINPIAGTPIRSVKERQIHDVFSTSNEFTYEIVHTQYVGHAYKIVQETVKNRSAHIIAIAGGDGTINEIAEPLFHSGIPIAILPTGSGNGLAHHLNIPMNLKKAIELIKIGQVAPIDVGVVKNKKFGQHYFLSNFGIGYDAEVIHAYADVKQRGFLTYLVFMVRSMFSLTPPKVRIRFHEFDEELTPFVFTVANSSQYGYRIEVAPEASISDGILDSLLVRDATFFRVLRFAVFSLLQIRTQVKDVAEFHQAKTIFLEFDQLTKIQIDGEPFFAKGETEVAIDQHALSVIVPN